MRKGGVWGEKKQAAVLIRDTGKWCLSYLLRSLLLPPFFRQMRYPRHTQCAGVLPQLLMGDALFYLMPCFWLVCSPGMSFFFCPPLSACFLLLSLICLQWIFFPTGMMLPLPAGALLAGAQVSQAGTKGPPLPQSLLGRQWALLENNENWQAWWSKAEKHMPGLPLSSL